jgi:hypothetical protein
MKLSKTSAKVLEARGNEMFNDNEVKEELLYNAFDITTDEEKKWVIQTKLNSSKFYDRVKQQPVSSFIRALEVKCRELSPVFNKLFKIEYVTSGIPIGYGQLNHLNNQFYMSYQIGIPEPNDYNEIRIRNIIAHEASHLYSAIQMLLYKHGHDICSKNTSLSFKTIFDYMNSRQGEQHSIYESKANVIGALILNERTKFHKDKVPKNAKCFCRTFSQIVKDMKQLKNTAS